MVHCLGQALSFTLTL